MKLRTVVQYLSIGLCAFPLPLVNAVQGYMSYENFVSWVHDNEQAFVTIGEDLRYLIYLVEVERPLLRPAEPTGVPDLDDLLGDVQKAFRQLHEAEKAEISAKKKTKDPSSDTFWSRGFDRIETVIKGFQIAYRQDVWTNRRTIDSQNSWVRSTAIDATLSLVEALDELRIDLTDPVAVAMWTLDARNIADQSPDNTPVVSYDTASLTRLRAAFKTIHDGFGAITEVIGNVYKGAEKAYNNQLDQPKIWAIETPLRKFQNFMYAYQSAFS
ncbi:hypothetical protein TWF281_008992 [Arthrobotrys megalospora]